VIVKWHASSVSLNNIERKNKNRTLVHSKNRDKTRAWLIAKFYSCSPNDIIHKSQLYVSDVPLGGHGQGTKAPNHFAMSRRQWSRWTLRDTQDSVRGLGQISLEGDDSRCHRICEVL
jgi:hypothetical protein